MRMDDSFAAVDFASDPEGDDFGDDASSGGSMTFRGPIIAGVVAVMAFGLFLARDAFRPMAARMAISAPHEYLDDQERLSFAPCKASEQELAKIASYYPDAKEVVLSGCAKLGPLALKGVARLKKLETLRLDGTKRLAPKGLALLAKIPALKDLSLRGAKIGDSGARALNGARKLERLDISGTSITEAGILALAGLPKLKTLVVDPAFAKAKVLVEIKKQRPSLALSLPGR